MAKMKRSTKFWFASWMIAGGFFAYAQGAFQEKRDNMGLVKFAFTYENEGPTTPWERLVARQVACRDNLVLIGVPLGQDNDALDPTQSCMGSRVLEQERAGTVLNAYQRAVAEAAKQYALQKRYYWIAFWFLIIGVIPLIAERLMHMRENLETHPNVLYRYCRQIINKMSR